MNVRDAMRLPSLAGLSAALLLMGVDGAASAQSYTFSQFGPNIVRTPPPDSVGEGYRYSRMVKLQYQTGENAVHNGEIVGTLQWLNADTVEGNIPIFLSTNDGRSFSAQPIYKVYDRTRPGLSLRSQPVMFEMPTAVGGLPAGTILLSALLRAQDVSGNTYIQLYKSEDAGRSFTLLSTIAQGGLPQEGQTPVWEPFITINGTGSSARLVVFYSDEREADGSQKLVHQVSADGINWGPVVDDVVNRPSGRPGMSVVARMKNNQYIMTYEECGSQFACAVRYKVSSNLENWLSIAGTTLSSPDTSIKPISTPYVVFLPNSSANGLIVVSSWFDRALYLNYEYAQPNTTWIRVTPPVNGAWSRSMTVMPDGKSILIGSTPKASDGKARWTTGNQSYGDVPATVTSGDWYFVDRSNGRRIGVADGAGAGAPLIEAAPSACACQKWRFVATDNGYHRLVNVQNGLTMEVQNGYVSDDRIVQTAASTNALNQQWRIIDRGTGFVQIFNRKSGKTFDNFGSTSASPALRQNRDSGLDRQQWTLTPAQ